MPAVIGGEAVEHGLWVIFWFLLAQLNFVLGAFNLLPLLPLDGGHIAVAAYEKIRDMVRTARGLLAAGPVDYMKLMPATYVVIVGGAYMLLTVTADMVNPISARSNRRHQRVTTVRRIGHAGTARRRCSRRGARPASCMVRDVGVGSDYPISVQSMCTTKTHDVNATLQQIAELTAAGCDIVRVACPRQEDADALAEIVQQEQHPGHRRHPLPAEVHLRRHRRRLRRRARQPRQHQGVRRPGQGGRQGRRDAGIPIRIGVNAGSLDKRFMEKYGKATPEALVESALWEASLFEEHGFGDIKISVKHNDPVIMVAAYDLLAAKCDYPLHLGVTEAGPAFQGTIKSAVAFGRCCPRASATPFGSRCPRRRSKRSRSAIRSWSR